MSNKKTDQEDSSAVSPLNNRYDQLIFFAEESGIKKAELLKEVKKLFPSFKEKNYIYDKKITECIIDLYAYNRSVGLSFEETAHALEMSVTLLAKVFDGEGIKLNTLIALAKAELFAKSKLKSKYVKEFEGIAGTKGKGYSPLTVLEKLFPESYSKDIIQVQHTVADSTELLKNRRIPVPQLPIAGLKETRKKRAKKKPTRKKKK